MQIELRVWDDKQKYMAVQGTPDLETLESLLHHFGHFSHRMLWTNLKTKDKEKIYVGDILENPKGERGEVDFNDGKFVLKAKKKNSYYYFDLTHGFCQNKKIIGNIYETPEKL